MPPFLRGKGARVLTICLLAQAGLVYGLARKERVPETRPLSEFPHEIGSWKILQEGVVEKEVMDVLKADDTLMRTYSASGERLPATLFIALFKSQRTGKAPHSPKNCLPGSGWVPTVSGTVNIPLSGAVPADVNRYVVEKQGSKILVLYWYQSHNRIVASEYLAKIYLVADSIRYNRSDTAIVRVSVPLPENYDIDKATATAVAFAQSLMDPLQTRLPA
jgi:EpsI family protein